VLSRIKTKRFAGLTCAVLGWSALAFSSASAQLPRPPVQPATVTGIVTAMGGEPIAGATVEARAAECGSSGGNAKSTRTGEDGRFTLEQLAPGSWCVGAAHSSGRFMPAEYQQRDLEGRGVALPLKEGQKAEIALSLFPTGSIAGRVFDVDGEAMPRVRVQVMRATYRDGMMRMYGYSVVQTDDRGDFRFFWLPPDRYYIAATVEDPDRPRAAYSIPPPGQAGTRVDTFPPYLIRRNTPSGEIVEETYRTVYFGGGLDPNRALPIDVRPGTAVDGVSVTLAGARTRAYHVRGTVIYTAPPPANTAARGGATPAATTAQAAAQARPVSQIRIAPREWSATATIASASTDPEGKFDVAGISPGAYDLYATTQGAAARTPIVVGNSHVENLRITPVAPYKVSGRLIVENPTLVATNEYRNFRLALVNDPEIPGLPITTINATASAEGVFNLSIPQGRFRAFVQPLLGQTQLAPLSVTKALENVYLRTIRLGGTDILVEGLSISGAPEGQLDVVLGTAGAVSGAVTNEGRPVVNATVVLVPDFYRARRDLYRVARTDGSGKYQIKGVPPGDYKALAWIDAREGQWHDPEFMRNYEARAVLVHVSEGIPAVADLPVASR
jgi:protocatechuate 3,4-dioxygenase beta subunit